MHGRQSRKPLARSFGIVATACVAVLLAGCAATPAEAPSVSESRPSESGGAGGAGDQTVQQACEASLRGVESAVNNLSSRITEAQADATSGKFPDLAAIAAEFGTSISEATSLVTNEEVLGAVNDMGTEVLAFGSIQSPASLIEVPRYLDALVQQWQRASTAHEKLTAMCGA